MPKIGRSHVWTAILLLCSAAVLAADSTDSLAPLTSSAPSVSSSVVQTTASAAIPFIAGLLPAAVSTCQSRTVNYITHTLPQQCLKANWTRSSNISAAATAAATADGHTGGSKSRDQAVDTDAAGSNTTETEGAAVPPTSAQGDPKGSASTIAVSSATEVSGDHTLNDTAETATSDALSNAASADADADADSPLDNANFLSFEEWKKQNLAKIGQSPENVGQGRSAGAEAHRRSISINNALDSLGDDNEIELDFGVFGGAKSESGQTKPKGSEGENNADTEAVEDTNEAPGKRRDAGVTCKERFNYASFDCAATVLKTNPRCKSSSSILLESKDSYMLNECAVDNKFIIVELCDDILIDTLVLANFEFFSSTFRTFKVSISDRYPVKADRWKDLGTFEARNTREIQAFPINNPLIWARYLRIEFMTHYGNEYYCPVSLLRVHGTTMMEEFRHQDDGTRSDGEMEEAIPEASEAASKLETDNDTGSNSDPATSSTIGSQLNDTKDNNLVAKAGNDTDKDSVTIDLPNESPSIQPAQEQPSVSARQSTTERPETRNASSPSPSVDSLSTAEELDRVGLWLNRTHLIDPSTEESKTEGGSALPATSASAGSELNSTAAVANSTVLPSKSSQPLQEPSRSAASQPQPPTPSPSTQESFFKSVHKRLQMLESNSTLSLQYIEEQSRILRDAFTKVEKKQTSKAEKFLDHLNDTVIAELKGFRQQYDQLWQSTVLELESHREQYQREVAAISTRLTIIADELVWQKRITVVQSTLLLLCLGLVVFARSGSSSSSTLELPLMQQMLSKPHSMLRLPLDSPPGSPSSRDASPPTSGTRKRPRLRQLFRRSSDQGSDASPVPSPAPAAQGPAVHLSPATPTADIADAIAEPGAVPNGLDASPVLRQTQSGPATPSGTRENLNPLDWDVDDPAASEDSPSKDSDRQRRGRYSRRTASGNQSQEIGAVQGTPAVSVHSASSTSDGAADADVLLMGADGFGDGDDG